MKKILHDMRLNRRQLLTAATGLGLVPYLDRLTTPAANAQEDLSEKPLDHFFLMVTFPGGMDKSYLCDARPLAMTAAGLQQNYNGQEPLLWQGKNGQSTYVSQTASALKPWLDQMALVNGVVMPLTTADHEDHLATMLTGATRGGDVFYNALTGSAPIDYFIVAQHDSRLKMARSGIRLQDLSSLASMRLIASTPPSYDTDAVFYDQLMDLYTSLSQNGGGVLSQATQKLQSAVQSHRNLKSFMTNLPDLTQGELWQSELNLAMSAFKQRVAKGAVIRGNTGNEFFALDAHDVGTCRNQPQFIGTVAQRLASILKQLSTTQFDETRSLLDVTTVMITSEFSRSMRQMNVAIGNTGTDHNFFANSVMFAGKGVRGGTVWGQSDFQTAGEVLSPLHLMHDSNKLCNFGRPFDFAKQQPVATLVEQFNPEQHITSQSVSNTMLKLMGVPETQWLSNINSRDPARAVGGLVL